MDVKADLSDVQPHHVIFFVLPDWLRARLKVSTEIYQRGALAIATEGVARDYFLFGALETLQRIGYTLQIVHHNLSFTNIEQLKDDLSGASGPSDLKKARLFVDHFVGVQLLSMRQLVELFVDILCFGETNEEPYYKQYMLLKGLTDADRLASDWRTFFECDNQMLSTVIAELSKTQLLAAAECDKADCWFIGKHGKPSSVFSRFKRAMRIAGPEERISLGFSYNTSYGLASKPAHVGLGAIRSKTNPYSAIDGYQRSVEHLGLQILTRFIELSGLEGTADDHRDVIGVLRQLPRYSTKGNHPEFVLEVDVGDLVMTSMYAGVVTEVRESAYGNKACRVLPVAFDSVAEELSDCWPAVALKRFASAAEVLHESRTMGLNLPDALSEEQRVELAIRYLQAILKSRRAD